MEDQILNNYYEPSTSIKYLYEENKLSGSILDYGCGNNDRNTRFLLSKGLNVLAYDPLYSKSNIVNSQLIKKEFDLVFTSYLLNTVDEIEEDKIIKECRNYSKNIIHIVRDTDIFLKASRAIKTERGIIHDQWRKYKKKNKDDSIFKFCYKGFKTTTGFQRMTKLEKKGFKLYKQVRGKYKIYVSGM